MSDQSPNSWEERVHELAQAFPYPATPDLSQTRGQRQASGARHTRQRLAVAVLMIVLVLASLLAVPSVRARLREWLRIGSVQITIITPTPAGQATAVPVTQAITDELNLAGETTLDEVRNTLQSPLLLPTYPEDLGQPDRIFLQRNGIDQESSAVILLWLDEADPTHVRLHLSVLDGDFWMRKLAMEQQVVETHVNGNQAVWLQGTHPLEWMTQDGRHFFTSRRLVQGNTLIWASRRLTYRLETELPLDEAIKVAESLR